MSESPLHDCRHAFSDKLLELGEEDERIVVVNNDSVGSSNTGPFRKRFPHRLVNVGIAEQNLVGVAAGLAYAGKRPFAYSIAPFLTSRPHDQVRVDVAMANAPVTLVGVGGGLAYGTLGPTHHAIEDLALMRALPNLTVLAPADPADARGATAAALRHDGPVYLRLGKNGEAPVLPAGTRFTIGRAVTVREGGDVALVSTGAILAEVVAAADRLAAAGVRATVLHLGTLKPLDTAAVARAAAWTGAVVTVEEHTVLGGLGSAVAETLAEAGAGARLRRLGLPDAFAPGVGARQHLLAQLGLDAGGIAAAALQLVGAGGWEGVRAA